MTRSLQILIQLKKASFCQIKYLCGNKITLHTQPINESLNVIIHNDLTAGSSDLIAPFCDVSGGVPPKRRVSRSILTVRRKKLCGCLIKIM